MDVEPGTIVVYSDIACPWSHVAVHRLHEARARLGLEVRFDHRAFPLELFNSRPTPKVTLDAETAVLAGVEPAAGWHAWTDPAHGYPVSSLLALEAVQAAKEQGADASETLDRELRRAMFARNECISLFHVVMSAAERATDVDAASLRDALLSGRFRRSVFDHMDEAKREEVKGSPHLFLADGCDFANPGIDKDWICGEEGEGFVVIHKDDPAIYEEIVRAASRTAR